jgi:hypothetical protein
MFLIIGGAPKAGTTSMYRYFKESDEVSSSKIKELKMLDSSKFDLTKYIENFETNSEGKVRLEATPSYLGNVNQVLDNINEDFNFIFILRDPSELFYSLFLHKRNKTKIIPDDMKFYDLVVELTDCRSGLIDNDLYNELKEQLDFGFYSNNLNKYYSALGERVKVVFFDDFKESPKATCSEICRHFGISDKFLDFVTFSVENKNRNYKSVFVHRLVHKIIMRCEYLFNKYPSVRVFFRSIYVKLNDKSIDTKIDFESKQLLDKYFDQSNSNTYGLLFERGVVRFPRWLKNE